MRYLLPILIYVAGLPGLSAEHYESDDDAARAVAGEAAAYLEDRGVRAIRVKRILVRGKDREESTQSIEDTRRIESLVGQLASALKSEDLREGRQRHTGPDSIAILFVIDGGPDIRLRPVGHDMFWIDMTPETRIEADWTNLQTEELTAALDPILGPSYERGRGTTGGSD